MTSYRTCIILTLAEILWTCALALQRPAPRYSQQYMPDTSFTCRNKIVGSYYADPETDCQLFHVCVSVAGSIQDYKFLCPNDTAFDQESQTCADWYDVDCEAATLYYASDNFDLYRLGSGLESVHYDNYRSDAEPQDQLQRSESSDLIRSSANSLARVQSNNNYNANTQKEVIKSSSSGNYYNSRNNNHGKESDYENEKIQKEDNVPEPRKKTSVRKIARKQPYNNNGDNNNKFNKNGNNNNNFNGNNNARNNYPQPSTTAAPLPNNQQSNKFQGHYYNNNNNNFNQSPTSNFPSSTTPPRQPTQQQDNFTRNQNNQRYNAPASTYQPTTKYQETYNSHLSPSTTATSTEYTNFNTNVYSTNQPSANNFNQSPSTTIRPSINYNQFTGSFNQPSTTVQPNTNYQPVDYSQTFHQRNYNTIQRNVNNAAQSSTFQQQPTTAATILYDNYSSGSTNNNNNNGQYNAVRTSASTAKTNYAQTTTRYYTNNFAGSSYIPTTYSPAAKKFSGNDNVAQSRGSDRYNGQYEKEAKLKDNGQYFDRLAQGGRSTAFYDSTNTEKHFDSSTASYDNYNFGRASSGIGFSPASVNLLAETPRATTPVPRKTPGVNTYNPSTFIPTTQRPSQAQTMPRANTFVSGSARPFSTTAKPVDATSARTKSGKKNDYDYAYYDNAGTLEYDGLELEHMTGNKESSKLSRN